MASSKISEAVIQDIFKSKFIDIVFDKNEWIWPAPLGKHASRLWNYYAKNKHPVSVDIARISKNNPSDIYLFEFKINIALAFSQCGYILLGSHIYNKEFGTTTHPYLVTLFDNNLVGKSDFIASLPLCTPSFNIKKADLINPFQDKTGLGLILLQINTTKKEIDKILIKEIPNGLSLMEKAIKAGIDCRLFEIL